MMKQLINISLEFEIVIGKVNLNEITYKLREIQSSLMLRILEDILKWYDDLIAERLSQTRGNSSKTRKGLGRHIGKGQPDNRFCRGRKVRKRGYRKHPRQFSTVFGLLKLPVRVVECCKCGALLFPLAKCVGYWPLRAEGSQF